MYSALHKRSTPDMQTQTALGSTLHTFSAPARPPMKKQQPVAKSFQFVSELPKPDAKLSAAAAKAAKAEQRRLVRSNAANYHWTQQRRTWRARQRLSSGSESDSLEEVSPTALGLSDSDFSDAKSPVMQRSVQLDAAKDDLVYLHSIYAPPDMSLNLMRFNAQYVIPRLVPSTQKGIANPSCSIWIQIAMENPPLFKTWIHCASVYYYAIKGHWSQQTPYLLSTHSTALEMMSKQMQSPVTASSDQNILAVWGLAVHGWEHFTPPGAKRPNQSSMKLVQSLERYSLMKFVPLHLNGLAALVEMRGGLDQIRLEGAAPIVSYTGLVESTKLLKKPRWPFMPLCKTFTPLAEMHSPMPSNHLLSNIGSGFMVAIQYQDSVTAYELLQVVLDMAAFTVLIYNNPEGFQESEGQVADQRNFIHHRLMSLPQSPDSQFQFLQNGTYEALRLASIIYSLLVVFPISFLTAPFGPLALQLRVQISKLEIENSKSDAELQLIYWIVFLGGVASIGSAERPWYVSTLSVISQRLNLTVWKDVKGLLECFLWLGTVSDMDGILLWEEIQQLHLRGSGPH